MFHCIPAQQRGRRLCRKSKTSGCSWALLSSERETQQCQKITGNLGTLFQICFTAAGPLLKTYMRDDVIVTRSEVAHGVCRVCQIGVKSEMHGLWVRHDRGRLLFLSPPQTRCLRVQVPLCGVNVSLPCLAPHNRGFLLFMYLFFCLDL